MLTSSLTPPLVVTWLMHRTSGLDVGVSGGFGGRVLVLPGMMWTRSFGVSLWICIVAPLDGAAIRLVVLSTLRVVPTRPCCDTFWRSYWMSSYCCTLPRVGCPTLPAAICSRWQHVLRNGVSVEQRLVQVLKLARYAITSGILVWLVV